LAGRKSGRFYTSLAFSFDSARKIFDMTR